MPVYIGSTAIAAAYVGSTLADKIYLGGTEVWPGGAPPAGPVRTTRASGSGVAGNGITTGSFTPSNSSLLVVVGGYVVTGGSGDQSATMTITNTAGLTFTARTNVGSAVAYATGMRIWTAPVTTGASMTVTVTCNFPGFSPLHVFASVVDYTGYNTTTPVGVTGIDAALAANGADSVTLAATPTSTSEIIGGRCANTAGFGVHAATPAAGHVEIHDLDSTDNGGMQTQARTAGSTSTAFAWDDVAGGSAILDNSNVGAAIEIKAAP